MRTIFLIFLIAGTQLAYGAEHSRNCGMFDTDKLRQDLIDNRPRNDQLWYETLINILAWQLDCERGKNGGVPPSNDPTRKHNGTTANP